MAAELRIGISGWTYTPWRGTFYPPDLTQKRELAFASRQLNSIEINGSFYSLQRPTSYQKWYDQTPEGFDFSIKASRFITHMKKCASRPEMPPTPPPSPKNPAPPGPPSNELVAGWHGWHWQRYSVASGLRITN